MSAVVRVCPPEARPEIKAAAAAVGELFGEKLAKHGLTAEVRRSPWSDGWELRIDFEYHCGITFDELTPEKIEEFRRGIDVMLENIGKHARGET